MSVERLIRLNEGLRLKPYRDSVSKLTIGVGRNLDDVGISEGEAEVLLQNDIARSRRELDNIAPWASALDEVRYGVLLDMCFNLGASGLAKFKRFLSAMKNEDWNIAAVELRNSKWWYQVGNRGPRLEKMVLTGHWPRELPEE